MVNFVGTFSGFLSPMLVAHFTQDRSTFEEWTKIFLIGGAVYIIPALIFMVFGSGEVQPWNTIEEEENGKRKESVSKETYMTHV